MEFHHIGSAHAGTIKMGGKLIGWNDFVLGSGLRDDFREPLEWSYHGTSLRGASLTPVGKHFRFVLGCWMLGVVGVLLEDKYSQNVNIKQ